MTLRIGVIGLRRRGMALAHQVAKCPGVWISALCDVDSRVLGVASNHVAALGYQAEGFRDYRRLCEHAGIDAVIIATPNHTHALIAATAIMHGKHAYVEKPVSHNVWEGRRLVELTESAGVVVHHGFQRRSDVSWQDALGWLAEGHLGKVTLARGLCYKHRMPIGHVGARVLPPATVDFDLWCGPRPRIHPRRQHFHYDWHWQLPYGNGDLGNQGSHQLDVCRWAIGDPGLPQAVVSAGARFGDKDDGDWPNTQLVWYDYGAVPILFEVRGLATAHPAPMVHGQPFTGPGVGNIIECEGGWLAGGHEACCTAYDAQGRVVRRFAEGGDHLQSFFTAIRNGAHARSLGVEAGHFSSALAHLGNISWLLGDGDQRLASHSDAAVGDAWERILQHLEANGLRDLRGMRVGPVLQFDPVTERFTGESAGRANPLLEGSYRRGFELPL